jgi:predicted molibdopterin-dependent oxidoreductase YjgC
MRILNHPILGKLSPRSWIEIEVDGEKTKAIEGEPIAAALIASGRYVFRYSKKFSEPRGIFCAIGRCTDCLMEVNGKPNVRSCVTAAEPGMKIRTLKGLTP